MKNKSLFMVNLAVFLFGMVGIFAKWISISTIGITFGRVCFSSLVLGLYMLLSGQRFFLETRRDLAALLAAGVVLAFHWWSFLHAIRISTVAIGTITFSTFPLFVTFMEPLVFKTRLTLRNLMCALVMIGGVAITIPSLSLESEMTLGILIGMGSAFSYAVLTLVNKSFVGRYTATKVAFYEQLTAAVVLLPVVLRAGLHPTRQDILVIFLLGVVTTAVAHTLFINSLQHLPAQLAGIISSMETVYGILFAFLLLGEVPGVREWIGAVVILGVVIFSQLERPSQKEPDV